MSGRGRGRRAKVTSINVDNNVNNGPVGSSSTESGKVPGSESAPSTSTTKTTKPKTTRKKQFPVIATITQDGIEGSLQPEIRRPLIAHLPIQSRNVIFHDEPLKYDPAPPSDVAPFGSFSDNPFSELSEQVLDGKSDTLTSQLAFTPLNSETKSKPSENVMKPDTIKVGGISSGSGAPTSSNTCTQPTIYQDTSVNKHSEPIDYYKKGTLLVKFKNSEETRKIPELSDAACFWCCHTFTTRPVILPLHDHGEYLSVFGNYCSPECAMSYLFDSHQDSHTRWEQLALLNRIYGDSVGGKITPAPPRSVLKHFGGLYSIEEYRDMIRSQKVRVDIHLPPMVSILATMDTKPIDFYDVSLTKNVMESVKERLQKAEEVLKLRRTKPLKAWESTLDACINLKVGIA